MTPQDTGKTIRTMLGKYRKAINKREWAEEARDKANVRLANARGTVASQEQALRKCLHETPGYSPGDGIYVPGTGLITFDQEGPIKIVPEVRIEESS